MDISTFPSYTTILISVGFWLAMNGCLSSDQDKNKTYEETQISNMLNLESIEPAVDSTLKAGDIYHAYQIGRDSLTSYYHTNQYEKGILLFELLSQYPISDTSLAKAKFFSNAAACYGQMYLPGISNRLMDTVLHVHQQRLEAGIKEGISRKFLFDVIGNKALILVFQGNYYQVAGLDSMAMKHFKQSLIYFDNTLDIINELSPDIRASAKARTYNNIAALYSAMGKHDIAQDYYQETSYYQRDTLRDGIYLENLGRELAAEGNYEKARIYLDSAIHKYWQIYDSIPYIAGPLQIIGLTFELQNDFPKALKYYQEALSYLSYDFEPSQNDVFANPRVNSVSRQVSLLEILQSKLNCLWQTIDTTNAQDLRSLLPVLELSFSSMKQLRNKTFHEEMAFLLGQKGTELIQDYLAILQKIEETDPVVDPSYLHRRAYQAVSATRANHVLQRIALSENEPEDFINEDLQMTELRIDSEIDYLIADLYRIKKMKGDTTGYLEIKNKLNDCRQKKDALLKQIEKNHPR
ncbi:MAG: tetratricopeptide repeat protein, partial [Bacteroidota bacterium]